MAEAWREAGEEAEKHKAREFSERLRLWSEEASALQQRARAFLAGSGIRPPSCEPPQLDDATKPAEEELGRYLEDARRALSVILSGRSSRLLSGAAPIALGGALVVGAGVIGGATTLGTDAPWLPAAARFASVAIVLVAAILILLHISARRSIRRTWLPFQSALAGFEATRARAEAEEQRQRERRLARIREREREEESNAHSQLDGPIAELPIAAAKRRRKAHERAIASEREANSGYAEVDRESATVRDAAIAAALMAAESGLRTESERYAREVELLEEEERRAWSEAKSSWIRDASTARGLLLAAEEHDRACQPNLQSIDHSTIGIERRTDWFRVGSISFDPRTLPDWLPPLSGFEVDLPERFVVPVCLGFPNRGNLVIEAMPRSRATALRTAHSAISRLLISIPPSKVRFTFIDPVALGESFADFMHLGDEFEQLVGERIWTEPRSIEQKLVDLTAHMETVIQKFLRNDFDDIDAYNRAAGEIAEPYRFVVCADFPSGFTEQAVARMVSILRAGQRCGVHLILLRDSSIPLPDALRADDLSTGCVLLRERSDELGKFTLGTGPLSGMAVQLDEPVREIVLQPLLQSVGRAAKTAARVEVPFDAIAPKTTDTADAFWSLSSAGGLRVPIGRAGATRLQQFALGEGTSQHALIAGKTGSGKSTLLHAIITGLATWYSPDEVELWLVDFKKGVEFKTYAEHALPHARAVAIESDREFGLSVLEGLDAELSRRGELFRAAGVQDIASFRKARPSERMPRVLLVIDEFQEFFLDDDRVAQGASMLLDRLVRQGRAFGMHALLGSQTLGGAYSLARSTMGQMGVRIALQCSEADSQLILSDENLAARLLSRPGEAIYNDAGGRLEGNSPFQVAYLPDEKRDTWLDAAANRARGRFDDLPRIVFEGDARASMALHPARKPLLKPDPRGSVRVWLGEAVAIKDPTCARLSRAAGANVAVISPRDDQAVSTSAAMLLSIAREAPGCIIDVFDGTPADAPEHGTLERIAREHGVDARFTPYREIESKLLEIATDVTARGNESGGQRRFLLVHQLQRYRALRRNEDDFSFGASDAPPSPDKMLAGLVREGPVAGVHVLVTCDTLASLQRGFDRNALREFDWKVLFQMSPADSSALIDSPAASRLGTNRGLLHSEELGMLEKFRPYALTS